MSFSRVWMLMANSVASLNMASLRALDVALNCLFVKLTGVFCRTCEVGKAHKKGVDRRATSKGRLCWRALPHKFTAYAPIATLNVVGALGLLPAGSRASAWRPKWPSCPSLAPNCTLSHICAVCTALPPLKRDASPFFRVLGLLVQVSSCCDPFWSARCCLAGGGCPCKCCALQGRAEGKPVRSCDCNVVSVPVDARSLA